MLARGLAQPLRRCEIGADCRDSVLPRSSGRPGDWTGPWMRICDDETGSTMLHRPGELAPTMNMLRAEWIFMAHEYKATAYLCGMAFEIFQCAATEIANFCTDAFGPGRLRAEEWIACKCSPVRERQRRLLGAPTRIRDALDTNCRVDLRQTVFRDLQRSAFALSSRTDTAAV